MFHVLVFSIDAFKLVEKLLLNPTVRIHNVAKTTEKLQKLIQDGRTNLHFISGKKKKI